MSGGISGFGTTLSGASTGAIGEITSLEVGGITVTDIDISTMASTGRYKEFVAGMIDASGLTLELLYEKSNMDTILAAVGGSNEAWTITLPDGSTFVNSGYINGLGLAVPMDDKISQPMSIKFTGVPAFTASS